MQLFLEDYKNAEVNFRNAIRIIEITHGRQHSLYEKLVFLIQQCIFERRTEK